MSKKCKAIQFKFYQLNSIFLQAVSTKLRYFKTKLIVNSMFIINKIKIFKIVYNKYGRINKSVNYLFRLYLNFNIIKVSQHKSK